MQVSIIIINYNTCRMTQECIDSIFDKTQGIEYEVILVDNGSKDGSKEHFEKLDAEGKLRYIYSFENMGFGRANNVGMMQAKGEYCLLLNSDTLLVNNAIKLFYDYAVDHDKVAFYGCWLESREGDLLKSYAFMPTIGGTLADASKAFLNYKRIVGGGKDPNENTLPYSEATEYEVDYVTGADLFFHRSIVDRYGGFDYNFFMYYEESDWQKRMKEFGVRSFLIHGPRIIHLEGASNQNKNKSTSTRGAIIYFNGMKTYMKKNYGTLQYVGFRIVYFLLRFFPILLNKRYSINERLKYLKALAS